MGMPFDDAINSFRDAARHARHDGNKPLEEIAEGLEKLAVAIKADMNALHNRISEVEK